MVRDCFDHAFRQRQLRDAETRLLVRDAIVTGIRIHSPSVVEAVVHKALICCGLDASERLYARLFDHLLPPLEAAVRSTDTKRDKEIRFMQGASIGLERGPSGRFAYHGEPISDKLVACDFLMTMFIHVRPSSRPLEVMPSADVRAANDGPRQAPHESGKWRPATGVAAQARRPPRRARIRTVLGREAVRCRRGAAAERPGASERSRCASPKRRAVPQSIIMPPAVLINWYISRHLGEERKRANNARTFGLDRYITGPIGVLHQGQRACTHYGEPFMESIVTLPK